MTQYESLFQQQSYKDAWTTYDMSLIGTVLAWDYVVLTASNEEQASAYKNQIDFRRGRHRLPPHTRFIVLPDRNGERVGSGGATLGVIRYIRQQEDTFAGKRILVIHSGGDSKRIPQYSACGKLFSPVPRRLPDGRRSTLFDEFLIGMSGVANRISEGMLVCSGDVLLLFNPLQIDFYGKGAAALSIKENVRIGLDHGVYLKSTTGNVACFLHKQTQETLYTLDAVDERGNVDIDTGAVILDVGILNSLHALIDTDDKYDTLVNERARLSFYADFLYPLAENSTLTQFYNEQPEGEYTEELRAGRKLLWEALHRFSMRLIRLSPASFIHFGTSGELRRLMAEDVERYAYLGWSKRVNSNCCCADFAANNSIISLQAEICKGAYIEDSIIEYDTVVGENCIISGVTLEGQTIPPNTVLHGLKLCDGSFVVRMYGVDDNPKEKMLFGQPIVAALWESPIYPTGSSMHDAVEATLKAYANGFAARGMSLRDSYRQADTLAILDWQGHLDEKVKVESILEAIDERAPIDNALTIFSDAITPRVEQRLLAEAERLNDDDLGRFSRKIRIYHALSKLTGNEVYAGQCFAVIRSVILCDAVAGFAYSPNARIVETEVIERLPVRVNWGGGWSDTPPYCIEHGGTVLNAAIKLDGQLPVEACVRRIEKGKIVLASGDNGSYKEFEDVTALQDSSNPFDPFALHKAALIACGIIPYQETVSIEEITSRLGGGVCLSTQVIGIPRGSGLGTSSILAGACIKALMRFLGMTLSDNELYNRVLCMEQLMSTGGGWQDQVGGLVPGIKMVTSDPGIHQKIGCTHVSIPGTALKELNERFCLIYTGQRRLARNLLRDVVGCYIASQPETVEVLYEIQRVAVLMRFELEKGNIDGFARLLNEHWALSKRLDAGSTNTCIDQLFATVDDLIDGKMICGAGGGGFLQVVLKKDVSFEQLDKRLHDVFQDSGARAWKCELVMSRQ